MGSLVFPAVQDEEIEGKGRATPKIANTMVRHTRGKRGRRKALF